MTDQLLKSSTLNCIHGSIELICSKNLSLSDALFTTNVSSAYFLHILKGCSVDLMTLISKSSMQRLATIGLVGDSMAALSSCSRNLPWNRKYVFFKQNSSRLAMCSTGIYVLLLELSILFQFSFDDLGGRVHSHRWKKIVTSQEVMHL